MAAIGTAFSDSVPAVGTSGTTYASTINSILTEVMSRLSVKVPVGSIAAAQAALDMNNQAVKNQSYSGFYEQTSTPSGVPYGRIEYFDGEFYMVTADGGIQITSEGSLNAAALAGIGGDYGGADPALLEFTAAGELYTFWDDSGAAEYAAIRAKRLDLVDEASGDMVRLAAPTTIAATYDLTFPDDVPAADASLLTLDNTGVLAYAEDVATVNPFTATVYHGDVEHIINLGPDGWEKIAGSGTPAWSTNDDSIGEAAGATYQVEFTVPPIPVGRVLKGVKARILQGAASTCTVTVYEADSTGASSVTPVPSLGSANTALAGTNQTITVSGLNATVEFGLTYKIRVAFSGGGAIPRWIYALSYTYSYPAP